MAFIHKHTTGDWFINQEKPLSPEDYLEITVEKEHKHFSKVAIGSVYDQNDEEGIANAKLIANAPRLLEAVEMFHDFLLQKKNEGSIAFDVVKKVIEDCGVEIENHV